MLIRCCLAIAVFFISLNVCAETFNAWQHAAVYEVEYQIDLSVLDKDQATNLWVPVPVEDHNQQLLSQTHVPENFPVAPKIIKDNRGNKFMQFELPIDANRANKLTFRYKIKRLPSTGQSTAQLGEFDRPERFLAASTKIPLDGLIAQIAVDEKGDANSVSDLQRRYYDYVYNSMTYSKEGEGWGQGDAIWACQSKYGNCTDFHSLYIGLLRSQNIPARFKIGFPLSAKSDTGRHDGYHCWAESYHADNGWLPVDASEAKKASSRDTYYGALPSDRIEFSQGRDIVLSSLQRGEPINYLVYPYAESSVKITNRLPVKFTYQRLSFK